MRFDSRSSEQVDALVAAFLGCSLPASFLPDGGVSFKPSADGSWPTGANLFSAPQLLEMFGRMFEIAESLNPSLALFFTVASEKHERKLIDRRLRMQRRELKRLNRQLRYILQGVDHGVKLQQAR